MVSRLSKPLLTNSFFLFGARGVGKSTLIRQLIKKNAYLIDLLDDEVFDRYLVEPKLLEKIANGQKYEWIIIDEVQRCPKLLNIVHKLIEEKKQKFALTGSSSRKIKRGGANLLAGRAFVNVLYPFTSLELKDDFDLTEVLHWGSLPKIYDLKTDAERKSYLRSYSLTYLKEEIIAEQIVRNLEPFREFLTVAAQCSGQVVNYSNIARDVGVQSPTVKTYFQILEETYIGFYLPQFHRSIRKSQIESPKFYFFDNGVQKALEASLDSKPTKGTAVYGHLFESFIVQEIFRLNEYFQKDYRLSFYRTKHGTEIDLVLSKGRKTILVEIKSSFKIDPKEVNTFSKIADDFGPESECYYLSQDTIEYKHEKIHCMHWQHFIKKFEKLK